MKSAQLSNNSYLLRLYPGDEIVASLVEFAKNHQNYFISFSGIGAVNKVEISYYNFDQRQYQNNEIIEDLEITSITGNISNFENAPAVHAHINLSDSKFQTLGGHLKSATVSITVEIVVQVFNKQVSRSYDQQFGINLIDMEAHGRYQPL